MFTLTYTATCYTLCFRWNLDLFASHSEIFQLALVILAVTWYLAIYTLEVLSKYL